MKTLPLFYVALLLFVFSCNTPTKKIEESNNLTQENIIKVKIETFVTSYLNKKDETVLADINCSV